MRPNAMGWVLVVFFGVGGAIFWAVIPGIWIGQIWVAVAAFLALLYVSMTIRARAAGQLAATGVRGVAHVLEITQTGTYVNNQPRVRLKLRIAAPGIASFECTKTVTVPLVALGALQPGRPLAVAVDPHKSERFVIDWFGNAAGPPLTLSTEDGRTVNLAGDTSATAAVMDVLRKYGLTATDGTDLRNHPQARSEVLAVLARAGHMGATPSTSPPLAEADDTDPAARLAKLAELRDSGVISSADFEEHKRRILSDI